MINKTKISLGEIVTVTIDRAMGTHHPNYLDLYYPINYGYIRGVLAPDGEEQDAYVIGVDKPIKEFTGKVIAIIHRLNDVEDKCVVAPENMVFSETQVLKYIIFQEKYFDITIEM